MRLTVCAEAVFIHCCHHPRNSLQHCAQLTGMIIKWPFQRLIEATLIRGHPMANDYTIALFERLFSDDVLPN